MIWPTAISPSMTALPAEGIAVSQVSPKKHDRVFSRQRIASDEITFVHVDEPGKPRLEWAHGCIDIRQVAQDSTLDPANGQGTR